MILRSSLPKIHYYQKKRLQVKESQYLLPTYSWTLTQIPNWTCFVVTISHFQCTTPNTWLTNLCEFQYATWSPTWEGCWLQSKFFSPSHDEDHEVAWSQNPMVYKTQQLLQEKEKLGQTRFPGTLFFTLVELCYCVTFYGPQNNPYICSGLWEKKAQTYIHGLDENQLEKLNFINLDRDRKSVV